MEDFATLARLADCLARTPSPPPAWLDGGAFPELRALATDAVERYADRARLRDLLAPVYQPAYFEEDHLSLAERFKGQYHSVGRYLRPRY
jgi:hypothetical protein